MARRSHIVFFIQNIAFDSIQDEDQSHHHLINYKDCLKQNNSTQQQNHTEDVHHDHHADHANHDH